MTVLMVPSPPAAMKRRCPSRRRSRISEMQSSSRVTWTTSSPASEAHCSSAESSDGAIFTPDDGLKNMTPLVFRSGNFGSGRGVCKTSMKRIAFLLALQVFVLPLAAAEPPKECALCAGAVSDLQVAPAAPVPLLVKLRQEDLAAAGTALDAMPPAVRAKISIIVSYAAESGKDPMAEVETHTQAIVDWAKQHGPFEGLGVDVANVDATVGGYAIKRLAVTAQGQ